MKKIIAFCGIALMAFGSQASYLWWTVDGTAESGFDAIKSYAQGELGITSPEQLLARVVQVDGDNEKRLVSETPGLFDTDWKTTNPIAVNLGAVTTGSSYSYYVEIVKASDKTVLVGYNTQATAYADLSGSITETLEAIPAVQNVWHGGSGSYKAAPEPTSAVLMLLGVAGLALRRKQRKLA